MALNFSRLIWAGAVSSLFLPGVVHAHDYRAGSVRIDHPWAVATPNGAKVGAGYMKITNEGTEPDRLISLTSPAARKVTLHRSTVERGVAKMRALDKGLEIKPGETIEMTLEGPHVMFEDLKAPLIEAGRVQGTLVFEKGGSVTVDYAIEPLGTKTRPAAKPAHSH